MSPPSSGKKQRREGNFGAILTNAMEDYVKAIYKIQQEQGRATTIRVADRLGLSAASVTNMVQKLGKLGIVEYAPYHGAQLTPTGERIALEIIRHHRLLELYLAEHMGYSWDEVDAEAEQLEHVISHEFATRIDQLLGFPEQDPHGDPIPTRDGELNRSDMYLRLADAPTGEALVIRRVSDDDPEALRFLGELGLYPGCRLEVSVEKSDPSPRVRVRIDGQEHDLSRDYALHVFVEPAPDDTPAQG